MELRLYVDVLKRHAPTIIIVAIVTVLVVAGVGIMSPPVYTAKATVRVMLDVGLTEFDLREDFNKRLLNTYGYLLKSTPFLEQAIANASPHSSLTASELASRIETQVVPDTELITIAVWDGNPALARSLANALAMLLIERGQIRYADSSKSAIQIVEEQLTSIEYRLELDRQQLANTLTRDVSSAEIEVLRNKIQSEEEAYNRLLERYEVVRLNQSLRANSIVLVEPASLPTSPSNLPSLKDIGLGLIIGLLGGIGLALVIENLDTRIHSNEQLVHLTNLLCLGVVPKGLLSVNAADSDSAENKPLGEAYRFLAVNLQSLRQDTRLQIILVTSAIAKEGKSIVAANLAQTLTEMGQATVLIEGDMRRPTLKEMLGVGNGSGLSYLLADQTSVSDETLTQVMRPSRRPGLWVIGAGGPEVSNPTALLASPSMHDLLEYLRTHGYTIILDSPPVLGAADVSVLAPQADGVVIIVRESFTTRDQILAAIKQLQVSRANLLGFVFLKKTSRNWDYR